MAFPKSVAGAKTAGTKIGRGKSSLKVIGDMKMGGKSGGKGKHKAY